MKTYIIHDYDSNYKLEIETDWTNPEIADLFMAEDIEEMDKLKVGESYEVAGSGVILEVVTRVK